MGELGTIALAMTTETTTAVSQPPPRVQYYIDSFTVFFLAFLGGLAFSRILYEGFFPQLLWLGRPFIALPFAAIIAFITWALWRKLTIHYSPFTIHHFSLTFSPFLLNLLWLFDPTVDLTRSRLLFAASVWLTAVLIAQSIGQENRRWRWLGIVFVVTAVLPVYLLTMSSHVGLADTFEFQVVTPKLGIVHPTGYPLYLILGKLFTLLPFGTLAWRLNFASVIYALAALSLLYLVLYRLVSRPLPAILGAVVTGVTVTLWSQAIIAEVYALHALIVMTAVFFMVEIGDWRLTIFNAETQRRREVSYLAGVRKDTLIILLAFVIGLGMANHVTSIFLIPPAILTVLLTHVARRPPDYRLPLTDYRFYLKLLVAFFLPLFLYAYLPLRWQAVNGEPMGLARFVDWVVAGRFQGALQLRAWLDDPTRYEIIGRLFVDNWGWFNLVVAGFGFVVLLWRRWQTAVVLFTLWLGTTFYTLNYYVPDLAVFVIPAQLMVGLCWGMGAYTFLEIGDQRLEIGTFRISSLQSLISTFIIIPSLLLAAEQWSLNDQSGANALEQWGRAVLNLPLAENAAILADSEKIAPLNYLQVAEGLRPDLDISVWPDEAAYREQINGRLAANQTVYLARQIPGLQSQYHLRSLGPLTEVATEPLTQLPNLPISQSPNLQFGSIRLLGYQLDPIAPEDDAATAVTFYWQTDEPISEPLHVYVKLDDAVSHGRHPANDFYPTNAWLPGEIVSDYHLLPELILSAPETAVLQVALAPPFTNSAALDWQAVAQIDLPAAQAWLGGRPYRAQVGGSVIEAVHFPDQTRPQKPLPLLVSGLGNGGDLEFSFVQDSQPAMSTNQSMTADRPPFTDHSFVVAAALPTDLENGRYYLTTQTSNSPAMCGWMKPSTEACVLGYVDISGVALPDTAVNFDDKIALLEVTMPDSELQPGGVLEVNINWLALAEMADDYTVTVQVLDAQDHLVGQTDSWPVQGTRPTSQWQPGDNITDPYTIQLASDLPSGQYRLLIGLYLLGDGRRLPVINENGTAVDDKVILPGLTVP